MSTPCTYPKCDGGSPTGYCHKDCAPIAFARARSMLLNAIWTAEYSEQPDDERDYDPNVAPCDDAEFGMKP